MAGTLLNKKIGIIGGGVTGVITAIFLAKSGCSVTIFEKKELLSETSSRTTKLLHGGIRYLESFQINSISGGDRCTFRESNVFFSYRRDGTDSGRMAHLIWMTKD